MLYTNVPESIYNSVVDSETDYNTNTIDIDDFMYYNDKPKCYTGCSIFTPTKSEPRKDLSKHNIYHDGILRGFVYLYETTYIGDKVLNEFIKDFLETTYEYDNDKWRCLRQIDGLSDINRIKDVIEEKSDQYYYSKV